MGALVLEGGWSPYDRDVPFRGLASVCEQILEWWSTLDRSEREQIAAALRQALGDGCAIVTEAFPSLESVLGIHPRPAASGTLERRNRLTHCLTTLLAALGGPERPVVLLFEDLQWVDAASRPIIEGLPGRASLRNLLTVASVRTGADGIDESFLTDVVAVAEQHGQTVRTLLVSPFEIGDTRLFLASALGVPTSEVEPLAEVLGHLSLGNPLALRELLASAAGQGLVKFDRGEGRWTWSVDAIQRSHLPEGVAQILANRLSLLGTDELTTLRVGSCIGARFDVRAVAELLQKSAPSIRSALDGGVAAGFLLPIEGSDRKDDADVTYQFRHERVQSAAYSGLSVNEQERLHATRGAALLALHQSTGNNDFLFESLTHLNRSHNLRSAEQDLAVARHNLKGAELAYQATAYDTAAQLLVHATSQLPGDVWETDAELAFGAALLHAECEYLSRRTDSAERAYAAILARKLSPERCMTILTNRMRMLSNMGRFEESAADGLECLKRLGMEIPLKPRSSQVIGPMLTALLQNWRIPAAPERITIGGIDERTSATFACLADLWGPAFWLNENLTGLVVFAMVKLSLTRGNTAASAIGYASYGVFLAAALKRARLGKRVCALGVAVAERAGDPVYIGRARFMYEAFFGHLDGPLRGAPAVFRKLVTACLRGGDYPYAGAAANMFLYYLPVVGTPLADFMPQAREIIGVARQTEQSRTIMTVDILRRWIEILEGRAEHSVPRFSAENAFVQGRLNESERGLYHLFEISLFYFLEDYEAAIPHIECLPGNKMLSGYFAVYYAFFSALVLARRWLRGGKGAGGLSAVRTHRKIVAEHAKACPENYRHMQLLLDAIDAMSRNRDGVAASLFQAAIEDANRQGFPHNAAIAAEWLAELFQRQGDEVSSARVLRQARLWYHQWGCMVKVGVIDRQHPPGVSATRESSPSTPPAAEEVWLNSARSVLDAARALSQEAVPSRLAERLIVSIVEHTDATRAVLLIREDNELSVACERRARSRDEGAGASASAHPETKGDVPSLIVNYVDRLGRATRLTASDDHELFGRDPYVASHPGVALMCVPLMHMRQSLGVLFLEKPGRGVGFSQADLVTAEVLAAQAAATLSNQREYNERLAALQNQMHPHFLFNALNGIAELTCADPPRAERALLNLSALYRNILVSSRQSQITLKQELDLIASYLDLEKLRFGSRLSYQFEVKGDPATTLVPPLVVQPLVENSVNHGIALKPEGGLITVAATVTERRVHVRVSDTGAGMSVGGSGRGAGLGLQSIRRRLQLAFGNEAEVSVSSGSGVIVDLFFPTRAAEAVKSDAPATGKAPRPASSSEPLARQELTS